MGIGEIKMYTLFSGLIYWYWKIIENNGRMEEIKKKNLINVTCAID